VRGERREERGERRKERGERREEKGERREEKGERREERGERNYRLPIADYRLPIEHKTAMNHRSRIYIAGHRGMVGSAIVRCLAGSGYGNLVMRSHPELDLTDQQAVAAFFVKEKPEYVFLAAARVGGIVANNTYRAQFIFENLMIQNNILHQSYVHGVKKLLFLGSSCIYPKYATQPISEEQLLTGLLEYTNEPYAIAKIAGIKMCEAYNDQYGCDFIPVMPTNLYGPNDQYDFEHSHVLPALIRKIYLARCLEEGDFTAIQRDLAGQRSAGQRSAGQRSAGQRSAGQRSAGQQRSEATSRRKSGSAAGSQERVLRSAATKDLQHAEDILVTLSAYGIRKDPRGAVTLTLWGTGTPRREFLHVDDLARAVLFVMEKLHAGDIRTVIRDRDGRPEAVYSHLNIGSGTDLTIKELALLVSETIGFRGEIRFDPSKPDGTPRKLMDVSKINNLGWHPSIGLEEGIREVYRDYINFDF